MTEQVRASGFSVPPVPAGAEVTQHSREQPQHQLPPQNQQPGFVPPAQTPAPAQQPAPAPAAASAVDPTIAALLAALSGQPSAAAPSTPTPAPTAAAPAPASGDPLVSSLTGILSGSGVDVNRAIQNAIEYGDVNLIDRAYLESVGGKSADHLIRVAESLVQHDIRTDAAALQAAHTAAGGQANWNAATAAFNASAPAHMQQVVSVMANSGNPAQIQAATQMVVEFARANGAAIVPAGLIQAQAGMANQQALSKEAFQAELLKLDRNARDYEQRRGELFGRRQIGKRQGM